MPSLPQPSLLKPLPISSAFPSIEVAVQASRKGVRSSPGWRHGFISFGRQRHGEARGLSSASHDVYNGAIEREVEPGGAAKTARVRRGSAEVHVDADMTKCRKANPTTKELTADELSAYFHLPINEVAKKLGLCVTVLKARCRDNGITRWPYRKVRKLDNIIRALESNRKCAGREDCKKQLAVLKETRDVLLSNPNSTAHLKLGKLRTAKKFLVALERERPKNVAEQSPCKLSAAKPTPVKVEPGQQTSQPCLPSVDKGPSKADMLAGGNQNILNGNQSAFRKIPVVLVQQRSTSSDDTTVPQACGVGPLSTEKPQGTWSGGNSPNAVADFNRFFPSQGIKDEPGESRAPVMTQAGMMNMPPGWNSMMSGPPQMPHTPWLMANMPFVPMPGFPQSPFPAHADPQQFQAFQVAYQAAFQQLMKQGLAGTQVNQDVAASH